MFYINYEQQYAYHCFHRLCSSDQVFQWPSLKQPSPPFAIQTPLNLDPPINLAAVHSTIQTGKTNEQNRKSLSSTPSSPALSLPRAQKHSLSQATYHKLQKTSFPDLHMIKESEEKTSLRTGSSWFGVFLRSIKNRSWKFYLSGTTIFPHRICSKTLKLNITHSLTVIFLNIKLHNYQKTSHKQMSNLVVWGSLNARHH